MKKLTLTIFLVLLLCASASAAYAGDSYDIEDLYITLEAPEDWLVMTLDPLDNTEAEAYLGIDSAAIIDYLEKSFMYINFLKKDISAEIFINMVQNEGSQEVISINEYSDKQLEVYAAGVMSISKEELENSLEDMDFEGIMSDDIKWQKYDIYRHSQAVFVKFYYSKYVNGVEIPSVQYSTIQNGQAINISISSYTGEVTDSLEAVGKDLVDSIHFTQLQEGKKPVDLYSVVRNILVFVCVVGITGLLIAKSKISQKKKSAEEQPKQE